MNREMSTADALKIIGVSPGASEQEVKRAYRKMMPKLHPDLATDDEDRERRSGESTRLNAAYEHVCKHGTSVPTPTASPQTAESTETASDAPEARPSRPAPQKQPEPSTGAPNASKGHAEPEMPSQVTPEDLEPEPITLIDRLSYSWRLLVRASPFILLSFVLRRFGFWDGLLRHRSWPAETFSGDSAWTMAVLTAGAVVVIAAIGLRRVSTVVLVGAAVFYLGYTEAPADMDWGPGLVVFGLLVVLPVSRILSTTYRQALINVSQRISQLRDA